MSESRVVRNRIESAAGRVDEPAESGERAILAQTTTESSYPVSTGRAIACVPVDVDGAEQEGSAATFNADASRTFYAVCLGPDLPDSGSRVVVHSVGGRWAFNWYKS